jgi:hypothetical protein
MENKYHLAATALWLVFASAAQAQDLAGIGFADLSSGGAEIGFSEALDHSDYTGLLIFINPDDLSVQIAPNPGDDMVPAALSGLIGFAIQGDFSAINISDAGVQIDVDGDGSFVNLGACLTKEGVRLTVTSPENEALWTEYRSLPYDTEATCAD